MKVPEESEWMSISLAMLELKMINKESDTSMMLTFK